MTRIPMLIVLAVLLVIPAWAQEPTWQADFGQPLAGFSTYREADSGVTLSMTVADGQPVLHAECAGAQALEGPAITTATVLPGGRRATIRAQVRGIGECWLIAHSRNGWLYSRAAVPLTAEWQELTLCKPLDLRDDRVRICLVTREAGPMTLEVRALSVTIEPALETWDAAVPPTHFEAEELALLERDVAQVDGALGGAVVQARQYALLAGIPCPRTSRPVYVFARVRLPSTAVTLGVQEDTGNGVQRINTMVGADTRDWQWIGGEPFTVDMVGDSFDLCLYGSADVPGDAQIDCVVVTTEVEPLVTTLDAVSAQPMPGWPTLAIGRAAAPPVIDGRRDDDCWARAVALTGFTRVGSAVPAQHPSELRLCWDDSYLYWWFRGEEPVLRTEMQRLADFRRTVTERDANVWSDDALGLILDTGDGIFDLFVNALGTVNDSRITSRDDLWGSRDESFDAQVEAVSEVGEGYWTSEGRMSLAEIGVPAVGGTWRFIAGRWEQADSETSAWNLCTRGLHDATAFAELHFAEETLGARVTVPEALQPGTNAVQATIETGEGGGLLGASLRRDGRRAAAWGFGTAGSEAVAPLAIEGEGTVEFGYTLLDATTLQPLVVSPSYVRSVRSSSAQVALTTDRSWRLLINEQVVGWGGSADGKTFAVPLQRGLNAFALELQGEAQVRIEAGDLVITAADPWRVAPDAVVDASDPEVDPRGWEVATGVRLGPGRLRFELLWEDTRVWPNAQPALYVCSGTPQHVSIVARGLAGHRLENYRCHLWLPTGLTVAGVTGYYATGNEALPEYFAERVGETEIDGTLFAHWVVSADQPIAYRPNVYIIELFNVFLAWEEGAQPEDRDYPVYFAAEANGGSLREARQSFMVRPLPVLNGAQPRQLIVQLWGSFFGNMDAPNARALSLQTARAAGFNNVVAGDRETSELRDEFGIENVLAVNFEPWSIDMAPWLEEHPESALIDRTGAASGHLACSSAVLDEAYPFVDARLRALIAERLCHWVTWDFEYGVMTGQLSCFCPRCLEAFRAEVSLAANLPLDPTTIERDHLPAWTEFMNRRMARLALKFKETCHAAQPPARLQVYSGYQCEDTKWRYGVDWAMIGELQACDLASCGYGRSWEQLRATHTALRGIPLVVGELMHPYDRNSDDVLVPATRAVMLRRLMDCTGGVLLYDRLPVEGRTWQACADMTRLAAAHEEVFAEGEFASLPGIEDAAAWASARRLGDTMIVAVMNQGRETKTYTLTLPAGYVTAREFFTGGVATPGAEVTIELAPGDAQAWVLMQ